MGIKALGDNCVFAYMPDLELIWGTICLLMGQDAHTLCTEIYGPDQIAHWKSQYHFLFETFQAMERAPQLCMMDFILDLELDGLTLARFRKAVLALPPEDFIWRQLELESIPDADLSVVRRALTDDAALDTVYHWVADRGIHFLSFSAFCRQSRRFITEFFDLAEQLHTSALDEVLRLQQPRFERMYQSLCEGAKGGDFLALSQEMMGKTFRNRGPYAQFVFLPSYLLPMKACRYFHTTGERKRQILFLSTRHIERSIADTAKALKAIADPTRYQILSILAKEGPLRGLEIAKRVSLATSTVSHHMEQMKISGLITEEPVKNSKYYGVNKQAAKALLDDISKDLQIK